MMEDQQKKNGRILGISLLVVVAFVVGLLVGRNYSAKDAGMVLSASSGKKADMTMFWNVWETTKKNYVDADKLDEKTMVYGAIRGMISAISDVGTTYLDPEETKEYNAVSEGKYFEGIGAELGYHEGQIIVVAPIEGSPAKAAGIRPGDYILSRWIYLLRRYSI